jgi:hypothetical protein
MSSECDCIKYVGAAQHTSQCRHPDTVAEKVKVHLDYFSILLSCDNNWTKDVFSIQMTPNRPQGDVCQHEMDEALLRAGLELRSWHDSKKDIMQEWTISRWKAQQVCPLYGKYKFCTVAGSYVPV